ncbi:unnamed protein product [Thelazia callipaeda]|uniref:RNA helicase n=1 Tax=Thelazia callipaeda TaxID=103827 RepID=A0A0N5D269_THECL|nr:unnamed protein product [Thelazia callipaeda]
MHSCKKLNIHHLITTLHPLALKMKAFSAEAKGSTKKAAKAICALSLLQQLFDNHLIDSSDSKKNKSSVKNLPKIPVNVSDKISREIMEYLKLVGVNEARLPSSLSEPVSLLITQKLNHFETSDLVSESCVLWSPALPNWNPWKSVSIDETPLASMSLEEISTALLDQEKKKFVQPHIKAQRRSLPVFQFRSHLIDTIGNNQITLIKGETGCGKSTQVCQYLLENYLENGRGSEFAAFITQPRKLSATTLAERVAVERGEDLGKSVGYSVRFDSFPPRPYGSMMFVTVGVLLKRLEFGLCGISHVIVDEIHERDINTDVILIILRDMMKIYPDLRVVLMSASIDTKIFTNYFDGCGVVVIEGRRFPVQYYFLEDIIQMIQFSPSTSKSKKKQKYECDEDGQEPTEEVQNLNLISGDEYNSNTKLAMSLLSEREIPFELIEALLIDIAKEGEKGAVLIFLPSWSAIQCMLNILRAHSLFGDKLRFAILPLHSRLAKQEQHKVFDHYSADVRKIILSTNIAETSVTIDDIVYVIDSCKTREKVYTSHNNMVHYVTDWSSRTNVIQRRGRAGRLREGFCFHLCSKSRFAALEEHQKPEILKIPLHEIALSIKLIGLGSVGDFLAKAIEAPPVSSVIEAERLLQEMSALDASNELTPLGRLLAKLPVEPVFGKTLILATVLGVGDLFATLSAASSLAAPYVVHCGASSISSQHRTFAGTRFSDHVALLCIYDKWRKMKSVMAEKDFCERLSLSSAVLKMISNVRRQMIDILISSGFHNSLFMPVDICSQGYDKNIDLVLSLLVYALYPNIGHLRDERRVFTLEKTTALISKHSVNTSLDSTNTIKFPSPLFVFSEKIRTNIISCNQISNITPIQLLLFGGCKVEYHGDNIIKLDNIISLEMDVQAASRIVALRPCIEALVVKACLNPQACSSLPENSDSKLIALLEKLSSNFGWSSHPQEKLDEAQQICGSVETISRTNCMRDNFNSKKDC